jgi:hypothetical protein
MSAGKIHTITNYLISKIRQVANEKNVLETAKL